MHVNLIISKWNNERLFFPYNYIYKKLLEFTILIYTRKLVFKHLFDYL